MTKKFDPEKARDKSLGVLAHTMSLVDANRINLAREIEAQYTQAMQPGFGDATVNMVMAVLAILHDKCETETEIHDANDSPQSLKRQMN
jgi:hypothetical protein